MCVIILLFYSEIIQKFIGHFSIFLDSSIAGDCVCFAAQKLLLLTLRSSSWWTWKWAGERSPRYIRSRRNRRGSVAAVQGKNVHATHPHTYENGVRVCVCVWGDRERKQRESRARAHQNQKTICEIHLGLFLFCVFFFFLFYIYILVPHRRWATALTEWESEASVMLCFRSRMYLVQSEKGMLKQMCVHGRTNYA